MRRRGMSRKTRKGVGTQKREQKVVPKAHKGGTRVRVSGWLAIIGLRGQEVGGGEVV